VQIALTESDDDDAPPPLDAIADDPVAARTVLVFSPERQKQQQQKPQKRQPTALRRGFLSSGREPRTRQAQAKEEMPFIRSAAAAAAAAAASAASRPAATALPDAADDGGAPASLGRLLAQKCAAADAVAASARSIPDALRVPRDPAAAQRDALIGALTPTEESVAAVSADPALARGFADGRVMAAVAEIARNPALADTKYARDAEVTAFYRAFASFAAKRLARA